MFIGPTQSEKLARARVDLRMGVPIVLSEGDQSIVVLAAETLSKDRLQMLLTLDQPVIAITNRRADTLKARSYDGDIARISLGSDVRVEWIQSVADPSDDLSMPMKGPFQSIRDGDAGLHRFALLQAKAARILPAVVAANLENPTQFATENSLTHIDLGDTSAEIQGPNTLVEVVNASLPLSVSENSKLHVFRPDDGGEEHYAIEIGKPDRSKPVLTRLHSACFTGDLLGSLKCDCGPQLWSALAQMGDAQSGILLYLNQEGRGIGLANKMRAYSLQNQGFDTVEANHRLGFEDDERDFRTGSEILKQLGVTSIQLLTNNPKKVEMMQANGIDVVERIPLKVGKNPLNAKYLKTKANKSGHDL